MCYKALIFFVLCLCKYSIAEDFYSFSVEDPEGNEVPLSKYRGKVTLVVNVASQCGFADTTYRALTRLHDILSYDGYFSVLAFPCNQFGEQEPNDASEIVPAVRAEFGAEFPIFNKINILGSTASPAFKNLIEQSSVVPDWNFFKYLVDADGHVLNAWGTRTTIEEIFDDIQAAINAAKEKSALSPESETEPTNKEKEGRGDDRDEL